MSHKLQLSRQRVKTVLNNTSKRQESALMRAVVRVRAALEKDFKGLKFDQEPQWRLVDVIKSLREQFPDVAFCSCFATSSMKPDGGILSMLDRGGKRYPILISEKKNQRTNDLRMRQGKGKQAKGNDIERLGKNVIGFRASLLAESIFPFVCFGDGCDFADDSSIVDRVKTISMFGALNEIHLHNEGPNGAFNRGTYYFRVPEWTEDEMFSISLEVARRSVLYYFSKYGEREFLKSRRQGKREKT